MFNLSPKQKDYASRLELGILIWRNEGEYGYVTGLAREKGVSRWFLYYCCLFLWKEVLLTERISQTSNQKPVELVLRLYGDFHGCLEAIRQHLKWSYGETQSIGYLSNLINRVGSELKESDQVSEGLWVLVIDEVFESNRPILVSVDPGSGFLFHASLVPSYDFDHWDEYLKKIVGDNKNLLIAGDRGKSLRKAAKNHGHYQSDLYHELIPFKRILDKLESQVLKCIKEEDKTKKYLQGWGDDDYVKGHLSYQNDVKETQRYMSLHADFEYLLSELYIALEFIDPQLGRIKRANEMEGKVRVVFELMGQISHFPLEKLLSSVKWNLNEWFSYLTSELEVLGYSYMKVVLYQ